MIVWREKFLATAIHFLVTLTLAAIAAALIFLVWFPDPFQTMIGGTELFMLVVGCDLALGPLMSLVIYNSRKSRRALSDRLHRSSASCRSPRWCTACSSWRTRARCTSRSATDRSRSSTARDINDEGARGRARSALRTLPLDGTAVRGDQGAGRRSAATHIFESMAGNEEHHAAALLRAYESQLAQIRARAKTIAELEKTASRQQAADRRRDARTSDVPAERIRWLPVHHRKGFWTAIIDTDNGRPVA